MPLHPDIAAVLSAELKKKPAATPLFTGVPE